MKSGGPWNLRGLRPETREVARDAARRSGVSVGEWLNSVIREDDDDHGEPMRSADYDDDDDAWRDDKRREPRYDDPRESRYADRAARRRRGRPEQDEPPRRGARHGHDRDHDELTSRRRQREREAEIEREAALAREEFGEVHARLDRLTQQLERMAQTDAPRLTGAPAPQPHVYQAAPQPHVYQPPPPPPSIRAPGHRPLLSVDNAVAEIAQRQRQLYGDDAASRIAPVAARDFRLDGAVPGAGGRCSSAAVTRYRAACRGAARRYQQSRRAAARHHGADRIVAAVERA